MRKLLKRSKQECRSVGDALDDGVCGAVGQPPCRPEPRRVIRVLLEDAIDLRLQRRPGIGLLAGAWCAAHYLLAARTLRADLARAPD